MKHESFSNFFFSFRLSRPSHWLRTGCMAAEVGYLNVSGALPTLPQGPVRRTRTVASGR